jgi:hypothetical protein
MKVFILLSAIIEVLAGLILLLAPQLVPDFSQASAGNLALARMYGAAALGLGVFAFHVWQHMRSQVMQMAFLQTYLVFNLGVAIAAYTCFTAGIFKNLGVCILHTILGLVTAYFFIVKKKSEA